MGGKTTHSDFILCDCANDIRELKFQIKELLRGSRPTKDNENKTRGAPFGNPTN